MTISEAFDEQPWAKRLARRKDNFKYMINHAMIKRPNSLIVETGTAWNEDNFEGQGQSTLIWDWALEQEPELLGLISIDIREEAVEHAKSKCKSDRTSFRVGESVQVLSKIAPDIISKTAVLYLDSMDWAPEINFASAFQHLLELTTVYALLPSGCLVVVDDRHGDQKGKHWMVEVFFQQLAIPPVFKNHQMGWIKP